MPIATNAKGQPGTKRAKGSPAAAFLGLALEFVTVGLFTIVAGTNDELADIIVLMMFALWIIYLVTNAHVVQVLETYVANLSFETGVTTNP